VAAAEAAFWSLDNKALVPSEVEVAAWAAYAPWHGPAPGGDAIWSSQPLQSKTGL
jgi:hypothetical protein